MTPSPAFEKAVSDLLLKGYGITWAEAAGDPDILANAEEQGDTPEDFVERMAEKFDLTPINTRYA